MRSLSWDFVLITFVRALTRSLRMSVAGTFMKSVNENSLRLFYIKEIYRGEIISDVKGSGWFVLKFSLPPFSLTLPSVVQFSKQNL